MNMETGDTEMQVNDPVPVEARQVSRTYEDRLVDAYREAYNNNDPDNLDAVHAEIEALERKKEERDKANTGPLTRSERLTALKNAAEQTEDTEERTNLQSEVAAMEAENLKRNMVRGPLPREAQLAELRSRAADTTDSEELANLQGQIQDLESQPANEQSGASDRGAIHWIAARGTFYAVSLLEDVDASGNAPNRCYGLYQMEVDQAADETPRNIRGFDNLTMTGARGNQPILLTSVTLGQRDIVGQAACLENQKVFYTFGQNFGNIQITGEILLGALADAKAQDEGIQTLREFFANYRVSVFKKPVAVTISRNEAVFAYLVGLDIGNLDAEFNILPFTFHGVLLDLAKIPVGSVNPQGSVTVDGVQALTEKLLDEPQELKRLLALRDLPEAEVVVAAQRKAADSVKSGDVAQVTESTQIDDVERSETQAELNARQYAVAEDNMPRSIWARIAEKQSAGDTLTEPEQALLKHQKNMVRLKNGGPVRDSAGRIHTTRNSYWEANSAEITAIRNQSADADPLVFAANYRGDNSIYKRAERQRAIEAANAVPTAPIAN